MVNKIVVVRHRSRLALIVFASIWIVSIIFLLMVVSFLSGCRHIDPAIQVGEGRLIQSEERVLRKSIWENKYGRVYHHFEMLRSQTPITDLKKQISY